jgi:hypothetical protein
MSLALLLMQMSVILFNFCVSKVIGTKRSGIRPSKDVIQYLYKNKYQNILHR